MKSYCQLIIFLFSALGLCFSSCKVNRHTENQDAIRLYELGDACFDNSYDSVIYYINALTRSSSADAIFLGNKLRINYFFFLEQKDSALYFAHRNLFLLSQNPNPKELANTYNQIGAIYNQIGNLDSAALYLNKAIKAFKNIGDIKQMGSVMTNLGVTYYYKHEYSKAITMYDSAINIAQTYSDTNRLVSAHLNMGQLYSELQEYPKTIYNYEQALFYARQSVRLFNVAIILRNMGALEQEWKKNEKAMDYYLETEKLFLQLGDSINYAISLLNIGTIYGDSSKNDKALSYYQKAYKIFRQSNYKEGEAIGLWNIASYKLGEEKFDQAELLYLKSMDIYNEIDDKIGIAKCFKALGKLNMLKGNSEMSEKYFLSSADLAKKNSFRLILLDSYKGISELYESTGRFHNSLQFYKLFKIYSDSVFNENSHKQLIHANVRYETDKRLEEIENLTNEKQLQQEQIKNQFLALAAVIMSGFALVIILILLNRQRFIKHQYHLALARQKMLRSQINPHFLFNALTTIQGYILEKPSGEVSEFIGRFAVLMRGILESSVKDYIVLSEEIEIARSYLEIQQLRYQGLFTYTIEVSPELEIENIEIPPMLFQPFIENAIEHGVQKSAEAGVITLNYYIKDGNLAITLTDNGPGLKNENKTDKGHISRAMEITRQRIELLGKFNKRHYSYSVDNNYSADGHVIGVKVVFDLPLIGLY